MGDYEKEEMVEIFEKLDDILQSQESINKRIDNIINKINNIVTIPCIHDVNVKMVEKHGLQLIK